MTDRSRGESLIPFLRLGHVSRFVSSRPAIIDFHVRRSFSQPLLVEGVWTQLHFFLPNSKGIAAVAKELGLKILWKSTSHACVSFVRSSQPEFQIPLRSQDLETIHMLISRLLPTCAQLDQPIGLQDSFQYGRVERLQDGLIFGFI